MPFYHTTDSIDALPGTGCISVCCEHLVSSCCLVHGTAAAFSDRMPASPSLAFTPRVFLTQPTVSACTSVHCRSVRASWMTVSTMRRWMPWCSTNVPQHGSSSDCETLVDTYLTHTVTRDHPYMMWLIDRLNCGFTSHSTQNRSLWRRFPKPVSWLGMKKI